MNIGIPKATAPNKAVPIAPFAQNNQLITTRVAATLDASTRHVERERLRTVLQETRQRGYAVEHGEVTPGLASVAAAVLDRVQSAGPVA